MMSYPKFIHGSWIWGFEGVSWSWACMSSRIMPIWAVVPPDCAPSYLSQGDDVTSELANLSACTWNERLSMTVKIVIEDHLIIVYVCHWSLKAHCQSFFLSFGFSLHGNSFCYVNVKKKKWGGGAHIRRHSLWGAVLFPVFDMGPELVYGKWVRSQQSQLQANKRMHAQRLTCAFWPAR